MKNHINNQNHENNTADHAEFGELLKFTVAGYTVGLVLGVLLDSITHSVNALGQWIVRTFAGEGESIFEGFYALRQRLRSSTVSLAEAYGWGKFAGMVAPWFIDGGSRLLGMNVYGVEGFYIPYFYALSDQIGATISGFLFFRRKEGSFGKALRHYFRSPVMVSSVLIIVLVPAGLFLARILGFSPTTHVRTALETIAANLCWVPPFVGMLYERAERHSSNNSPLHSDDHHTAPDEKTLAS